MIRRLFIILLCVIACSTLSHAQSYTLEDLIIEVIDVDEYDEDQITELYERLSELEANPKNINTAEYDDFAVIPLLNIDQISDIMYYRDKYGYLRTMEELSLIRSIDRPMRLLLSRLFFAAQPPVKPWYKGESFDSLMHHGHGSALVSAGIPLYERAGNADYLGDKYKYSVKVKGHFADYIKFGITGSKDDGEPFLRNGNRQGFDSYSFYLTLNRIGIVKTLVLGRFNVKFGEGIILNNGFSLGKQYMLSSTGTASTAISGHGSRSDSHYLQGAATTIAPFRNGFFKNVELSAFLSYRYLDATLSSDGSVRTIITSGYHRKDTEMGKHNNTSEMMTGGRISWKHNGWHAGVSGVYTNYNRILTPANSLYKRYAPHGDAFWNASADYGYLSHRFAFSGETATGDCGSIATLNTLAVRLPHNVKLTAVQRYYAYQYYAMLASAFSDGGYVQNESGIYIGVSLPLASHLSLSCYTDYAYFPWARYRTSSSSYSWDNSATLTYSRNTWNVQGRYRIRKRQIDAEDMLVTRTEHTARLVYNKEIGNWTLRTQGDWHSIVSPIGDTNGHAISQTVTAKLWKIISASLTMAYFNTKDYDSRIYIYERGLVESYGMSSFYGRGIRSSGILRADIGKKWMLAAKFGVTNYFDRTTISSSDRMIPQSYKPDVDVQLRYKF